MLRKNAGRPRILILGAIALALAGCGQDAGGPPPQAAVPQVTVQEVAPTAVTVVNELPGRTMAYRVAEVRPQVNGLVKQRMFEEGSDVEEGEQLYQIDDAIYQAAHKKAAANLRTAELQARRYAELAKVNAVSRQAHDDAQAAYLRAANGNIAAARAAFFPRIVLTGTAGRASADLSGLFSGGSGAWAFLPRLDLPIFDFGNRQANLDLAQVQRDINIARYERTIQNGFREVADALVARSRYVDQLQAQEDLLEEAQRTHTLSVHRYETGVDSFLQVLDAQRTLFNAQQSLLATRLQQQLNLVQLYRALGGG